MMQGHLKFHKVEEEEEEEMKEIHYSGTANDLSQF
jgi:hypothetical protein